MAQQQQQQQMAVDGDVAGAAVAIDAAESPAATATAAVVVSDVPMMQAAPVTVAPPDSAAAPASSSSTSSPSSPGADHSAALGTWIAVSLSPQGPSVPPSGSSYTILPSFVPISCFLNVVQNAFLLLLLFGDTVTAIFAHDVNTMLTRHSHPHPLFVPCIVVLLAFCSMFCCTYAIYRSCLILPRGTLEQRLWVH